MLNEECGVVVEDGHCGQCSVSTKLVFHRHFPEVRAECGSVAESAAHLVSQLTLSREGAQSAWHRALIDRAIADVIAFLAAPAKPDQPTTPACQCSARPATPTLSPFPERSPPAGTGGITTSV